MASIVSRRELLRNLAVGGAVAWVAPIATTVPASASTDTNPKQLCNGQDCQCGDCNFPCGTCSSDVGDGSWCWERLDRNGKLSYVNVCAEDVFCDQVEVCARQTDCPRGYACITNNGCTGCGFSFGVCSKKCRRGVAAPAHPAEGIRRLGRRTAKIR
jgi:hypothetical protein